MILDLKHGSPIVKLNTKSHSRTNYRFRRLYYATVHQYYGPSITPGRSGKNVIVYSQTRFRDPILQAGTRGSKTWCSQEQVYDHRALPFVKIYRRTLPATLVVTLYTTVIL
jgi:hypothetical protein